MALQIRETFINETKGYQFGDSEWYEPYTDNRGRLFREMQQDYGRCMGKVYLDVPRPDTAHSPAPAAPIATRRVFDVVAVGWVFSKTMPYEDARPSHYTDSGRPVYRDADYYERQVWVQTREVEENDNAANAA